MLTLKAKLQVLNPLMQVSWWRQGTQWKWWLWFSSTLSIQKCCSSVIYIYKCVFIYNYTHVYINSRVCKIIHPLQSSVYGTIFFPLKQIWPWFSCRCHHLSHVTPQSILRDKVRDWSGESKYLTLYIPEANSTNVTLGMSHFGIRHVSRAQRRYLLRLKKCSLIYSSLKSHKVPYSSFDN
jgi:hypothetical protein